MAGPWGGWGCARGLGCTIEFECSLDLSTVSEVKRIGKSNVQYVLYVELSTCSPSVCNMQCHVC